MADWSSASYVRKLIDQTGSAGFSVRVDWPWTRVGRADVQLPAHGWKLHVSARAQDLPEVAELVVPFLLARDCSFKLADSTATLAAINNGSEFPAAVGKAFTIYPDQAAVRTLGLALSDLLRGRSGPRILSDRRIDRESPVYYRYGPIGAGPVRILGPDGERFDGLADLRYRQPSWVADPFPPGDQPAPSEFLGGRDRVTCGIRRTPLGSVFRADDTAAGRRVIVKQARAHVGDPGNGIDARLRLRNERRVYSALGGVAGIPDFIDHFAHGEDEFLVSTDVGDENLRDHVLRHGGLVSDPLARLAARLARTLIAVHERGVVVRDIAPSNIVLGERAYLIDFGIAALDGFHPPGGTPGYASWRQFRDDATPSPADDHYSLGMTLAFTATGLQPLTAAETPRLAATRMLQSLHEIYGGTRATLVAVIADLLSEQPDVSAAALRALADEDWLDREHHGHVPAVVAPSRAPAHDLERRTLDLVLADVARFRPDQPGHAFAAIDGSISTGSPGIGLELLHHRDRPEVAGILERLAEHATRRTELPPGLFKGSTGIHLFLGRLHAAGFDVALPSVPAIPYDTEDEHADVFTGTAGAGLGHLALADTFADVAGLRQAHLDAARLCVESLLAKPELSLVARTGDHRDRAPAADVAHGYAHGRAGVLDLLLAFTARTGDPASRAAAEDEARSLVPWTAGLIDRASAPGAQALTVSGCRGLAGIGKTLLRAARVLDTPEFAVTAFAAAEVCAAWIPRLQSLGQCCGLTGVGTYLIDCALHSGEDRHWTAAHAVARQLLARSHGPDEAPRFIDPRLENAPASWSFGNAGILTFLRRLNRPHTANLIAVA